MADFGMEETIGKDSERDEITISVDSPLSMNPGKEQGVSRKENPRFDGMLKQGLVPKRSQGMLSGGGGLWGRIRSAWLAGRDLSTDHSTSLGGRSAEHPVDGHSAWSNGKHAEHKLNDPSAWLAGRRAEDPSDDSGAGRYTEYPSEDATAW